MDHKKKLIAAIVLAAAGAVGIGGSALWWLYLAKPAPARATPAGAPEGAATKNPHKYITLEKVIVMLRRNPGDAASHYMSTDLVITTTEALEKQTKEHLPLLRSIAVKSFSRYSMETASLMTVDQFAKQVNDAFEESYARQKIEKPFTEAMIGKLIIE